MNSCFYLSISVLPLGTVGAIEFLGPIILAVSQFRTARNFVSLGLAVAGVYFLTRIEITPAMATAMGIVVLRQFPSGPQLAGLALIVAGVALHRSEIRT